MQRRTKFIIAFALFLLLITLLPQAWLRLVRPPRSETTVELFEGIQYQRNVRSTPRPLVIHIVEVDLTTPGVRFLVTPADESSEMDLMARTTSTFLEEYDLQVAINANFFKPFRAGLLFWNDYPEPGDPVNATGLAISNGERYSPALRGTAALCILPEQVTMSAPDCPPRTTQAVAGNEFLVRDGRSTARRRNRALHPRTAVAIDESGKRLWLVVVDGRQRGYSEGVSLAELADLLLDLGADQAINLDGGGSSTLVMGELNGAQLLNAPINARIPMRERPVANHLGIYASPVTAHDP